MNLLIKMTCLIIILASCGCALSGKKKESAFDLVSNADRAYLEGRWLEASQSYYRVTQMVPDDHYAWFRLGNTQLRQGLIESAIYTYQQAIARDATHAKTHYNLSMAYILIALKSIEQAKASIRASDPGGAIIDHRLKMLQKLIDQPLEQSDSPAKKIYSEPN